MAPAEVRHIRPQPGPQLQFLSSAADIAVYGGAAGGGKTWALLIEPLRHIDNPGFGAVFFRRTTVQVRNEGGLWDESHKLYAEIGGAPRQSALAWRFPSGAGISFRHLEHDKSVYGWQGAQIPLICFDELTHFSERQFWYLVSRNRSTCGVAEFSDLEKRGDHWKDEPRLPVGQAGGGQWTTGGGGSAASGPAPADPPLSAPAPVWTPPIAPRAAREPEPTLDDGVYRPGNDGPRFIQIGGPPEETDAEAFIGSNGGPPLDEISPLQEMFPGLKDHPYATAIIAPFDHFIGFSSMADQAERTASAMVYQNLLDEIKAIDPKYNVDRVSPPGGFAGLPQTDRNRIIESTLMDRASAYYRVRGDAHPLQIETLKFLRKIVDKAFVDATQADHAGILTPRLSRQEAIGNFVDKVVRDQLKYLYKKHNIPYGVGQNITVNNRNYDGSSSQKNYVIPDARVGDTAFDWTIRMKKGSDSQIRGFFAADARPKGVVIIRPSQIDPNGGAYYIPRPPDMQGKR